jgi:hypothetical protein
MVAAATAGCSAPVVFNLTEELRPLVARGAAVYRLGPSRPGRGSSKGAASDALIELAPRELRRRLHHDATLDRVARVFLRIAHHGSNTASVPLKRWVTWRLGAPCETYTYWWRRSSRDEQLRQDLRRIVRGLRRSGAGRSHTYGIVRERYRGQLQQGVLVCERQLDLEPLPKVYEGGAPLMIRGRFLVAVEQPDLLATLPGGTTASVPIRPGPDGTFDVSLVLPRKPGRYFVEILGKVAETDERSRWDRLLWLPVYVGQQEPPDLDPMVRAAPGHGVPAARLPRRVLELVNRQRAAAGVGAVGLDPAISRIARRYTRARGVAGDGPAAEVMRELKRRDGTFAFCWQAALSIHQAEEFIWAYVNSPTRRRTILDPRIQRIGVAVVPGRDGRLTGWYLAYGRPTRVRVSDR